jgi:hypothetical protein
MRVVRSIGEAHQKIVAEMLEVMMAKNAAGRLPSLIVIGEEVGNPRPLYGVVGRVRSDPERAIGLLAVVKQKLTEYAADMAPDVDE